MKLSPETRTWLRSLDKLNPSLAAGLHEGLVGEWLRDMGDVKQPRPVDRRPSDVKRETKTK